MSQHDYVISNGTGAAVRSDLNSALAAIVSNNSGATAPTTTYAYQFWADTTTGLLKIRNSANSGWVTLRELDGTLTIEDGTVSAPGLAFTNDLNTGFYSVGADQLGVTTGGTQRLVFDSTGQIEATSLGTAAAPTFTFVGDPNTGIYSPGADQLALATAGTARVTIGATGGATFGSDVTLNAQSDLRFADADSSNWVAFQGPATVAANVTWTLPSADGTSNQVLSTNGSGTLSWLSAAVIASANAFTGANTFTNSTGQIFRQAATQDGVLVRGRAGGTSSYTLELIPTTLTASRVVTFPDATGTAALLGLAQSFSAAQRGAISALTDGVTITADFALANNFSVTLGGNRTLANPTNLTAGQSGAIFITQDATGSRTLAYGSSWDFSGGTAPTLTTTANAVDLLVYTVRSATSIHAQLITNLS